MGRDGPLKKRLRNVRDEMRDSNWGVKHTIFSFFRLSFCSSVPNAASFFLHLYCFPLTSNSLFQGLALTPNDAWAVHAVAHVYEMRAEVDKSLKFMEGREKDWEVWPWAVCLMNHIWATLYSLVQFSQSKFNSIMLWNSPRKNISSMYCLIPGSWHAGQSQLLALGSGLHREGKDSNQFPQSSE